MTGIRHKFFVSLFHKLYQLGLLLMYYHQQLLEFFDGLDDHIGQILEFFVQLWEFPIAFMFLLPLRSLFVCVEVTQ